ncbi:hypothetical protein AAC387_Pa05g2931 [Persea americana]
MTWEHQKQPAHSGWRSSGYIIGVEVAERFTYVGFGGNLVTYLTNVLHESTATAVKNVNIWVGASTLLPLFGAFITDSYSGRYHTILFSSLIYVLGLAAMTLTVAMAESQFQESLFFMSLYLVVIGQGGHMPCVQAFGADQFDESSEKERRDKNSFFNWRYFGQSSAAMTAMVMVFYLQDNVGWTISFGILAIAMALALVLFLLGWRSYRRQAPSRSPLTRVAQVLVAVARKLVLSSTIDDNVVNAQPSTFFTKQSSAIDRKIFSFIVPSASLQVAISLAVIVTIPVYDWLIVPITRRITRTPSGLTMLQRIGVGLFLSGPAAMTLTTAMVKCRLQESLFFISLYIVVIRQGGHKPCVQVFGADQFNESSEEERRAKNSFFNWWYFGQCSGAIAAMLIVYYLQDNMGWTIGFGILAIVMGLGLILFLLGRRLYHRQAPSGSPLTHVAQALVAVSIKLQLPSTIDDNGQKLENGWILEGFSLAPIISVVTAQAKNYFTKQSSIIDKEILSSFTVPSASPQLAISVSAIVTVPIYDWVIVPVTRRITGTPLGLRMLQRTGVGMFLSIIMMVVAALVERRRLQVARELELVDLPEEIIPLSVLWMLPQYIICGVSDVFISVGLQEFFYDQMPVEKRSIGAAAYLSIFGIGSFLSSGIISIVERINPGWLVDILNQAHLDYYYWLLAGLSTLWFGLSLCLAKRFRYK